MSAAQVEAHHRLRGGVPEDTIRALKNDFGMIHAPVQPFFGNWLYWQATALAHNVALWLRTLALPRAVRRARGKRLRISFQTSPPDWSATAAACTCASPRPTGTSTHSVTRCARSAPCPPSVDTRPATRHHDHRP